VTEAQRAAGAVLWRGPASQPQVAVIHRPKYDDWTFPKGKADPGEHILLAAVREVQEETGHSVRLGRPLPTVRYSAKGGPKQVWYWAALPDGGTSRATGFTPTAEVDRLDWLTIEEAVNRLTYRHDVELLDAFTGGPVTTTTHLLLRHASAGDRHQWRGDDARRPLDDLGRTQADALADLIACFGPTRVVPSDAERCVQTIAPYASRAGIPIEREPLFSEDAYEPRAATQRLASLLFSQQPAAVCSHRVVLPELLQRICERLGTPSPADAHLDKGAFWVVHMVGNALVALERHRVEP
jgi:8-oxo-(d)GTP phosphatase